MIDEPKQKNKAPEILIAAFFVCAGVCYGFSCLDFVKGPGIYQTLALIFFCAMIYVLVKFKFIKVRYIVRKKEQVNGSDSVISYPPSDLEMVIDRAQGSRAYITECLIALDDITDFVEVPKDKFQKKQLYSKYTKCPKYNYFKNIVGADKYLIEIRTQNGIASVEIECGNELRDYLSAVARYNKESIHHEE